MIKAINDQLIASPVSTWFEDCRFLSSAVAATRHATTNYQ
jgi:hypothetical protein